MQVPILDVRLDMLVIGTDGRKFRAVDRELSPVGRGIRRPWLWLHLQDLESGVVNVVKYRAGDVVEAELPPEPGLAEPRAAADSGGISDS